MYSVFNSLISMHISKNKKSLASEKIINYPLFNYSLWFWLQVVQVY